MPSAGTIRKLLQQVSTMGTESTTSRKEQRRVVWCNQLAVLCIVLVACFGIVIEAVVAGNNGVTRAGLYSSCGIFITISTAVLFLNKAGHLTLSRFILIMQAVVGITADAIYHVGASREPTTIVFILPIAMSFTLLFDATSSIKTNSTTTLLVVITAVCLTTVQIISAKPSSETVIIPDIVSSLVTMLAVSFCFYLVAKENQECDDGRLMEVAAGLQQQQDDLRAVSREYMEASLRKATKVKQDFLATMSHEIRTPINGVVASADLLSGTPLNSEQQDLTDTIKSSALALITIINDIFDFSKIEEGTIKIEHVPFNVRLVTEEVMDCVSFLAEERGVELVCDVAGPLLSDGVILSDPMRLRQVLLNLLGNAVKFTQDGSVTVEMRLSRLPSNTVLTTTTTDDSVGSSLNRAFNCNTPCMNLTNVAFSTTMSTTQDACGTAASCRLLQVTVTDTGIGIPSDRVEGLFEAFTQADSSTSRKHGGTGLGLTICSKLVALMGGKIGAQSQLGKGSTFSFFVVVGTTGDAPSAGSKSCAHRRSSQMTAAAADELMRCGPSSSCSSSSRASFRALFTKQLTGSIPGVVAPQSEIVVDLAGSTEGRSNDSTSQCEYSELMERQDGGGGGGGKKWGIMGWRRASHRLRSVEPFLSGLVVGAEDLPQQPATRLPPVVRLVLVVCEPLGTARAAICNLLRHHREEIQQEEEGGGQARVVVVQAVPAPADLGALVQVLEEEAQLRGIEEKTNDGVDDENHCIGGGSGDGRTGPCANGQKRKLVVVCDYRMLGMESGGGSAGVASAPPPPPAGPFSPAPPVSTFPSSSPPPQNFPPVEKKASLQQRRRSLGGLLTRLDAGLVLLGPRAHRSKVEAGAETDSVLNMGTTTASNDPTGGDNNDGGTPSQSRRRWEYVSKPIHMSLLLQALLQLTDPADIRRSTINISTARRVVHQLTDDDVGATATVPRCAVREEGVGQVEGEDEDSVSGAIVTGTECVSEELEVRGGGGGGEQRGGERRHEVGQMKECAGEGCRRGRETRVLVVEDNKVNQKVMGKMLTRLGVAFDIVENGELAVEAWTRQQEERGGTSAAPGAENYYGVVLMDCHMPVMDGFEATAAIRKLESSSSSVIENLPVVDTAAKMRAVGWAAGNEDGGRGREDDVQKKRKRVPIIAVTASALEEDMKRCRDVGMDLVMPKPVRLEKLYETLAPFVDCMVEPPPSPRRTPRSSSRRRIER